ncbi:adenylyltransferase/cytidyltransferase family protein [Pseudescherichia sp.]|uniref:adenylyltransferase/cytidyltransferase family protein n=1 Tax=Pseudescherichia sp. TaxID=2055881 RepID=UPI0028A01345|nr:adenylyltransferase/cytidyltransferase family protein [Pseudescherichia sp.]
MTTVITFGTFDLFHIGHLNILNRASELGQHLVVGVSSDKLNAHKKGRLPLYPQTDRMKIIQSLKCVDTVFLEESLALKTDYILRYSADILVMGSDWQGRFDHFSSLCQVIYFPRTPSVSTTAIVETIKGT